MDRKVTAKASPEGASQKSRNHLPTFYCKDSGREDRVGLRVKMASFRSPSKEQDPLALCGMPLGKRSLRRKSQGSLQWQYQVESSPLNGFDCHLMVQ